jgi:hypothetical protein
MNYTVEMGLYIHIQSFMKIDTGVQAILRFCISNFKYRNVGITDGRGL